MSTLGAILARHVDAPEDRHRLVLLAPLSLRCHDCAHTIDLRAAASGAGSTSTSTSSRQPPAPNDPDRCLRHVGEWAGNCRLCRAEAIADEGRERPRTGADPRRVPEWQQTRELLNSRRAAGLGDGS